MKPVVATISNALKEVFIKPQYAIIAAIFSFVIFALSVWLRNLPFLKQVIVSPAFSFPDKILLFVRFLGGIATNVTPFSAFMIILMSLLFGVNASLFLHYLMSQKRLPKKEGAGARGAFVSGMFGVGCASCGSFLLGSVLASVGASGAIALLPLRGEELTILSIALLSLSIYWTSMAMQSKKTCRIEFSN
jgi:hypothetical protein